MKRVLIATAHPDDLENGIGGTLTLLALAGFELHSLVMTLPCDAHQNAVRRVESIDSHAGLGVIPIFWDEPDGALEVTQRLRTMMQVAYDNIMPDIVLTLWPADVHPDHRACADIAMGPALKHGVNTELLCFEVCSSGRNTAEFRPQSIGFFPTHYVDTSMAQKQKRMLMDCHQSQDPEGMWAGMRNMHERRAIEAGGSGGSYKEAFVRLTRCGVMAPVLSEIFEQTTRILPRGIGVHFKPETIGISV